MCKIELEITDATQYATAYRDGRPIATVRRRRYLEKGAYWRAYALDGSELFNTLSNVSAAGLIRRIERALAKRDTAAAQPVQALPETVAPAAAQPESRPYTFDELTAAEQREVNFRGFARGADIRYFTRPKAAENDWQLVRWTRVQALPEPYRTQREANGTWSAFYGAGYMCGGFASEAKAETWIRDFFA